MADPRPQDTLNPEEVHAEQPEEATGDPGNSATDTATDAKVTEVPETLRGPGLPETGDHGDLYLPDMKNTRMKEACKKGIALGAGLFVVSCEGLKEFYDHTTLAIDANSGRIEIYINGEFDTFPLNTSESPFPEGILREILKSDAEKKQEAGIPNSTHRDNHRRDVHMHPRYSCDAPRCKVFKINSDELHQHKRDAHWDVFRFRCCVRPCYNVFKDRDTLMDHLFKVHDRGFARAKGQIPSYECDKCERTFQSIGMLIHHSSEHRENKRQCKECAWRFATWHQLIDHCINTHDTMHHACATCGKDFKTNDEKVTHCNEKHTGKCWICDKDFVLVEQLQVHLRDEHKMKDATSPQKTKELEEEHRRELEQRRRWERQQ